MNPNPVSWKTALQLCLPALLAGAVLRILLLLAIPEAWYGPDGGSYFHTATRLWTEGNLSMMDKRRWLYPAFLCLLPPLPGNPAQAVAAIQHLLGLALVVPVAMIAGRCTRFPKIWMPLVALAIATWPQGLWFEHSLETETFLVAAFVVVVLAGLPPDGKFSPRRLFWFLLLAALVAAWKPHGRGIWLACVGVAILQTGNPLRWSKGCRGALGFAALVILTSGSSGQGNWLLLNSTLPLVPLEGKQFPAERAALRPLLDEARAVADRYPWEEGNFKYRLSGSPSYQPVGKEWSELVRDGKRFSKVCRAFAMEGLAADPMRFAYWTLQKTALALSENGWDGRFQPKKFWKEQDEENDTRWSKRPREVGLLYEMDAATYERLVVERKTRVFAGADLVRWTARGWGWFREKPEDSPTLVMLTWSGWLALAGALWTLRPSAFRCQVILWFPAVCYALTVFAVGDRLGRYAYPLNWLGVIFVAIALDAVLGLISRPIRSQIDLAANFFGLIRLRPPHPPNERKNLSRR